MKIIAVASSKGGSGKSTLVRGLSVHASLDGLRVLIVDLDPQQTSAKWWSKNERQNPVVGDVGAKRDLSMLAGLDFDLIVIDTPPEHELTWRTHEAVRVSDLVLIPVRPSPDDIDAAGLSVTAALSAKKPFAFVPTQTTFRASLVSELIAALAEHGPVLPALAQRQDIPKAHQHGKVPVDLKPSCDAAAEMRALWWSISEMLKIEKTGLVRL